MQLLHSMDNLLEIYLELNMRRFVPWLFLKKEIYILQLNFKGNALVSWCKVYGNTKIRPSCNRACYNFQFDVPYRLLGNTDRF
uniref:Uncharacterized protein n=1 Tax=Lepeophtheirus salmonis TaxID=72036 RepID=A0A0K2UCB2_LEPSM